MDSKQTKNIWIGIIVIALVIGVYYFATKSNNLTTPKEISKDERITATTQKQTIDTQKENTPTSIDEASLKQGWKVIALGSGHTIKDSNDFSNEIIDLGQTINTDEALGFKCTTTYCSKENTQGKFIRVDIQVNNIGLKSELVKLTPAEVFDQNGRAYDSILASNKCADSTEFNYWTLNAQTIKPNIPCFMKVLYEVSRDSTSFTTKLFYKLETL